MSASILTQRLQRVCLGVLRNGGQSKNLVIATPNAYALQQQQESGQHHIHTGQSLAGGYVPPDGPRKWLQYNKIVYEPQAEHEEPRPAVKYTFLLCCTPELRLSLNNHTFQSPFPKQFVCHQRTDIKYSPWKMWYIASMVRGMTVDEALRQLSFVLKKGAGPVRDTILEAQQLAVERHNVEFRSNLWVAESFCSKGKVFKGVRRHARARVGRV